MKLSYEREILPLCSAHMLCIWGEGEIMDRGRDGCEGGKERKGEKVPHPAFVSS